MSFSAEVLRVLIASPSDVHKERDQIENAIFQWNSLYAEETGIILLPSRWENDVTPTYHGADPQQVINEQLVRKCDILIGVFWTKLGTPTLNHTSGTLEELNIFIEQGKEVMVYFLDKDIPRGINYQEVQKVEDYRSEYGKKGVYSPYDVSKIGNHLYRKVNDYKRKNSENFEEMTEPLPTPQVKTQQKEYDKYPFEEYILFGDFTLREIAMLKFIMDTDTRRFGARHQAEVTQEKIQEWEGENLFKNELSKRYEETLADFVERGLLEVSEVTSYDNPKLYSMSLAYFNQLRQITTGTKKYIDDLLNKEYFIF